jgi:hypothetical protein
VKDVWAGREGMKELTSNIKDEEEKRSRYSTSIHLYRPNFLHARSSYSAREETNGCMYSEHRTSTPSR